MTDAITLHGIAGRAHGNCHAETSAMLIVAACCHREESIAKAPAARIRGVELRLAPQTPLRRKSEPVHIFAASHPFDQRAVPMAVHGDRPGTPRVANLEV